MNIKNNRQKNFKIVVLSILLFYSGQVASQDSQVCNKLECVDDDFKKKYFVKYYSILNKSLVDARGCKDISKLDNVLEFTRKINSAGAREKMARFIEKEFISDPVCILSALKRISQDAKIKTSYYLAKPTVISRKRIYAILDDYKKQFPTEIQLILIAKGYI